MAAITRLPYYRRVPQFSSGTGRRSAARTLSGRNKGDAPGEQGQAISERWQSTNVVLAGCQTQSARVLHGDAAGRRRAQVVRRLLRLKRDGTAVKSNAIKFILDSCMARNRYLRPRGRRGCEPGLSQADGHEHRREELRRPALSRATGAPRCGNPGLLRGLAASRICAHRIARHAQGAQGHQGANPAILVGHTCCRDDRSDVATRDLREKLDDLREKLDTTAW